MNDFNNIMCYWPMLTECDRPNRLDVSKYTGGKNSKEYHVDNGRYCLWSGNNTYNSSFTYNSQINRAFWSGNQWILEEDLEAFLKDESGQARGRIKMIRNFIRSNVSIFVGNSERIDISCTAKSLSYSAINRREQALADLLTWTDIANGSDPAFADYVRSKKPIGRTKEETEEIFENIWTDKFEHTINNLLTYVAEENRFNQRKSEVGLDLCLTGMGIMKYLVHNIDMVFKRVVPERFIFDRSAQEYDLTDAEFMGEFDMLLPSEIFEEAQYITTEERKAIEDSSSKLISNRIQVFRMYWKDFERYTYGYVYDEFGYQCLVRINESIAGEDPKYTDKDLVPLKELNEDQKKVLKGKNKADLYVDVVRFVHFIPYEVLTSNEKGGDVVLDYGIMPYQDTNYLKLSNAKFPYKVCCWEYVNGVVSTPISQLINPQRMINRLSSTQENLYNNAKPPTIGIDVDLVDPKGGMAELMRSHYQGKFLQVKSRGRGINNAITNVGGTLDATVSLYDNAMANLKSTMDNIIGMNDAIRGENQGSGQLVGVTAMQIQRASIQQEPFFKALANIFEQCYQSVATVGKRVFINNDRKVPIMLGDEGAKILALSKEYELEDFRTFIKRDFNRQQQIDSANAILMSMLDRQMIDENTYADSYGRVTTDEMGSVIRKSVKAKGLIAKQQYELQSQQTQQENEMMQQAQAEQMMKEDQLNIDDLANKQADRENKVATATIKASAGRKNL